MKFTNLKKHALVGFVAGFILAILAGFLPWMDKVAGAPVSLSVKTTWALGSIFWLAVVILWEVIQYFIVTDKAAYVARKWRDSVADAVVGFLCFMLPWTVITLGTYAGNVLRL